MPDANSFPDGRRGRARSGDLGRVADYSASTLPVRGPGVVGRRFPSGSVVRALPVRRGGGTAKAATPPLTIVPATAKDKDGTPHPERVRVYNGYLGNLLPTEMHALDAVFPDGTDNHCYLTMQSGTNYVYGKVLVDTGSGQFIEAHVYRVESTEESDETYAYRLIGIVTYDGATPISTADIEQINSGHQSLLVLASPEGDASILYPFWVGNSPS